MESVSVTTNSSGGTSDSDTVKASNISNSARRVTLSPIKMNSTSKANKDAIAAIVIKSLGEERYHNLVDKHQQILLIQARFTCDFVMCRDDFILTTSFILDDGTAERLYNDLRAKYQPAPDAQGRTRQVNSGPPSIVLHDEGEDPSAASSVTATDSTAPLLGEQVVNNQGGAGHGVSGDRDKGQVTPVKVGEWKDDHQGDGGEEVQEEATAVQETDGNQEEANQDENAAKEENGEELESVDTLQYSASTDGSIRSKMQADLFK